MMLKELFKDEYLMLLMGPLEYDPELPKQNHRHFLQHTVVFKEVSPPTLR